MAFGSLRPAAIVCGFLFCAPALGAPQLLLSAIPAQPLPSALTAFAAQTHIQLLYEYNVVERFRSHAVRAGLDPQQALKELLRDTELEADYVSDTEVIIHLVRRERAQRRGHALSTARTGGPPDRPK